MAAKILDGKKRAEELKVELKAEVQGLRSQGVPKLATLQIGEDSASSVYLRSQEKVARECGIELEPIKVKPPFAIERLEKIIRKLNSDRGVTGIMIQHPFRLGEDRDADIIYSKIVPHKDVEGMHPQNLGGLFKVPIQTIIPPTARAVLDIIKTEVPLVKGKEVVIVGHSDIVGKPLSMILVNDLATVSMCHIGTYERGGLEDYISRADLLIVAVGKKELVKGEWIKEGAVVIDVGINKVGDKIFGDVEFDKAKERASYITPVPGGVGPITTVMLMKNCVRLFRLQRGLL